MLNKLMNDIRKEIYETIEKLGYLDNQVIPNPDAIVLETPKDKSFGDYATNVAMRLARVARKAPLVIANEISQNLDINKIHLSKIDAVAPGFINLTLDLNYLSNIINKVLTEDQAYGSLSIGENEHICLEYVSANPTGYLHVGHGRGAAYGASLANILKKAGYKVNREHYVNDAGNQITNMAKSVYARYEELFGRPLNIPEDGYHGKEIITVAEEFKKQYNDEYLDKFDLNLFRKFGTEKLLNNLKRDLKSFNVEFDTWFSETSLYESGAVENTLNLLKDNDFTYVKDEALWLKTSTYRDEKDRVIVKSDGSFTYLLPDIAYHANKLSRGYTHLIDVLGADHHGYIDRLHAAVSMVGGNSNLIDVEILQMVRVIENGEEIKMSKRSGKAITLIDLINEVGTDALRYFYVEKALSTHMDLDLGLMKQKSTDNPVYYAQYAHARISGIFEKWNSLGNEFTPVTEFKVLDLTKIKDLCLTLIKYPAVIEEAATKRLVHKLPQYINILASNLHSFYNDEKVITENIDETLEKLTVLKAVQVVLKDALSLIGVSAPEKMEQK
jgi:arginyl-tRNA synthetase